MSYSDDWSKERTLSLEGEAFFEVQKGSKFSVVTSDGIVEVLGTSFDVTV
jgi:transmembrane sensor